MGGYLSQGNVLGDPGSEQVGEKLKKNSNLKSSSKTVSKLREWQI
jgi:hypothetical protein